MVASGITVAFYNPEKRRKRMKAYQEYINQLTAEKEHNSMDENAAGTELTESGKDMLDE